MIDITLIRASAKGVGSALRHPKGGAFQKRVFHFVREAKARMKKKRWPFNAPRPRQAAGEEAQTTTKERKASSFVSIVEDPFNNFDGVHTAVRTESGTSSILVRSKRYPPPTGWASRGIVTPQSDPVPTREQESVKPEEDAKQTQDSKYEYIRDLMPGAPNPVTLVKHTNSGKLMVMKTLKVGEGKADLGAAIEAFTLEKFVKPHRNIIELHEAFFVETPAVCKMVVEYCSGGDLFDFIKYWMGRRKENVPEMFILHFIASMGEALGYLHLGCRFRSDSDGVGLATIEQDPEHQPILHRDIKPENIFLRWSAQNKYGMPDIVLGDFGGATLESDSYTCYGTPGYYPPEVLRFLRLRDTDRDAYRQACGTKIMTRASDMYTFGMCLWWMIDKRNIEPDRLTTSILFDWANVLNVHVQFLYQNGVRMPAKSWQNPAPTESEGKKGSLRSESSAYSQDAGVGAESVGRASQVSDVSNPCRRLTHRGRRLRHPGPNLISQAGKSPDGLLSNTRAAKTYDDIPAAGSDDPVIESSKNVLRRQWQPQSCLADFVSRFSDDSDLTAYSSRSQ